MCVSVENYQIERKKKRRKSPLLYIRVNRKPCSVLNDDLSTAQIALRLKPPPESRRTTLMLCCRELLRIRFTWQMRLRTSGELLPRLSTLAVVKRRYISVALSLRSPSADVISYPVLSSTDFPHGHKCPRHRMFYS